MKFGRSRWLCNLRRRSAAARFPGYLGSKSRWGQGFSSLVFVVCCVS